MLKSNSNLTIVLGVLVLTLFALGGVLLIAPGTEATYRLGLLFGVIGTGLAAFVGMMKAAQAAENTNGKLDHRIQAAVHRANNARRAGDVPLTEDQVNDL